MFVYADNIYFSVLIISLYNIAHTFINIIIYMDVFMYQFKWLYYYYYAYSCTSKEEQKIVCLTRN